MKVKSESEVAQLCLTLRDPMDCSLPGSSVHVIFQARVLEWVAIAFSICGTTRLQSYFQKWLHHDTSPSNVKGFQFLYILKLFFFQKIFKNFYLFIYYFWLRWVFIALCGLSLVGANGGYSSLHCSGFSLGWLLLCGRPWQPDDKGSACSVGDLGSIPGLGRSLGEGNDQPLQYSGLVNPQTEEPAGYSPWGHKDLDMTK